MGSINGESSKELLEAQSHLWNHTFSFINSMSLKCAIELGIPDIIHRNEKPMNLADLSNALSIPQSRIPHLRRLMRLLVHSKFFSEHQQLFSLTKFSEILVKEKSGSLSPFLHLMLGETLLSPWHYLSDWFKCDGPPTAFENAHGMPVWEATGKSGEFNRMMNEGMSSDARFTAEIIVTDCGEVFRGLTSLVDVGGGLGTLARAIARAFPAVTCTVLDLPHVIEGLDGESEMVQFVGGDMFEHVPPADATLLKWILHDWNDQECVKILKRCKEAIPTKEAGGKVIIIDMVLNTNNAHEFVETQLLFDIHMMAHTTGKQRSETEWKEIFTDAGFRGYRILPTLGLRSVIEWILHDWNDQECVKILKRCKEAIPTKEAGGKVIIIDMVLNTNNAHEFVETQLLFDIHMMAHTTGKQRSETEWKEIFTDAGFRGYRILPTLGLRSVIEVYH